MPKIVKDDLVILYPNKLEVQLNEVVHFGADCGKHIKNKQKYFVQVYETKRHELCGRVVKNKENNQ